eukprot:scaffold96187_cov56-Phaeocystis_antarctica.AAC.5
MGRRKGRRKVTSCVIEVKGLVQNRDLGCARALSSAELRELSNLSGHRRLSATAAVALAAVVQDGDDPRPLGPTLWSWSLQAEVRGTPRVSRLIRYALRLYLIS